MVPWFIRHSPIQPCCQLGMAASLCGQGSRGRRAGCSSHHRPGDRLEGPRQLNVHTSRMFRRSGLPAEQGTVGVSAVSVVFLQLWTTANPGHLQGNGLLERTVAGGCDAGWMGRAQSTAYFPGLKHVIRPLRSVRDSDSRGGTSIWVRARPSCRPPASPQRQRRGLGLRLFP